MKSSARGEFEITIYAHEEIAFINGFIEKAKLLETQLLTKNRLTVSI